MLKDCGLALLACVNLMAAMAAERPYIGFVYPAGGEQGATFQVKLGGQGLEEVCQATVSGSRVHAKVLSYFRRLGNQEADLLREQLKELKQAHPELARSKSVEKSFMPPGVYSKTLLNATEGYGPAQIVARIEQRFAENVNTPASNALSNIVFVEVTVAFDAEPGPRELRLVTARGGASNPLVFYVGQEPEIIRKPMLAAPLQILGKEELALRRRPPDEAEQRIIVPCTVNGQVASGEVNRYRFNAKKGQRLVLSTHARELIPFIADTVPGWFQPVLAVYNSAGKELAYNDDYRFNPDPVICFEVPHDGEYVFTICDALYRGREDFVYRVTIAEEPFITSIFPLGARAGTVAKVEIKGWNLDKAQLDLPSLSAVPGIRHISARRDGVVSNHVPFALDELPECVEKEPNHDRATAQKVELPVIVNGRIGQPGERDVFEFSGYAGQKIVAEVNARRLGSPLDSELKLFDSSGKLITFNDDYDDGTFGANSHPADSYLMRTLPGDGTYFVQIDDAAGNGGEEFAYRLRISEPRPDFELRLVPSSLAIRRQSTAGIDVRVIRKDGFVAPIALGLKNPLYGFSVQPATATSSQEVIRLNLKTTLDALTEPVILRIEGVAKIGDKEMAREAVPSEDRMQAFLWRHLVPARDFKVLVYDPEKGPPSKRPLPKLH